ncbi:uncharacterized protein TNCV_648701 [Trichonephila clavipes]|uniref:Uncharacterized protein n=1 Tax=Trichonephila clavipes TaxID=2585209 RepID=A0A8X6VDW9_TRICX|nr:uncharacterized protein TNCV_648701 [Trichonephila clavipes]
MSNSSAISRLVKCGLFSSVGSQNIIIDLGWSSRSITYLEAQIPEMKFAKPSLTKHHWYQCSRPGGSLAHGFTRQDQTLLTRFRSGHIKSMKISEGRKSFGMCTNCSSEPAKPAHILECLGLTKQDLADVTLLVLDFQKAYDVMDLV